MSIVIGIDAGGSMTKIAGTEDGHVIKSCVCAPAGDPIDNTLNKFMRDNGITPGDIAHAMLTGVGASSIGNDICGIPASRVDEFQADGMGARHLSGLDRFVAVSMGTGTTLVRVEGDEIRHMGGISMGGGALVGLSRLMLHTTDIGKVAEMASHGDVSRVNLQIKDISEEEIEGLPMHATASLFAKAAKSDARPEDIAKGIIWAVLETIGSCAVLSQINGGLKDFVLIGSLTQLPECREIFPMMEDLYGVRFHIPGHARFATALGAALGYNNHG